MEGKYKTHRDLDLWKNSIQLVKYIYEITNNFPNNEMYGLISQLRRAAVSVPSNIAEGSARHSKKEFVQFLYIASGSLSEIETQLIISNELNYISTTELEKLINLLNELRAQLYGLIKYLNK